MNTASIERQRKTKEPCSGCGLHKQRCICHLMKRVPTATRICLVVHAKELKRTTNTGRLALQALSNCEMHVRGLGQIDLSPVLNPHYQNLLLYPSLDAIELTPDLVHSFDRPIQLIVPDGNWRQASKVHIRHKELAHVQRVKLPAMAHERLHIRRENTPEGMATLEAIAHAMGLIEGPETGSYLYSIYEAKLEQTLAGRQGGGI